MLASVLGPAAQVWVGSASVPSAGSCCRWGKGVTPVALRVRASPRRWAWCPVSQVGVQGSTFLLCRSRCLAPALPRPERRWTAGMGEGPGGPHYPAPVCGWWGLSPPPAGRHAWPACVITSQHFILLVSFHFLGMWAPKYFILACGCRLLSS